MVLLATTFNSISQRQTDKQCTALTSRTEIGFVGRSRQCLHNRIQANKSLEKTKLNDSFFSSDIESSGNNELTVTVT
jgi:hypothetical protein